MIAELKLEKQKSKQSENLAAPRSPVSQSDNVRAAEEGPHPDGRFFRDGRGIRQHPRAVRRGNAENGGRDEQVPRGVAQQGLQRPQEFVLDLTLKVIVDCIIFLAIVCENG